MTPRNPFENLPLSELQRPLHEDVMEILDYCLRTTVRPGAYTHEKLWGDKPTLALLYLVISIDRLAREDFRQHVLACQSEAALTQLAKDCAIAVPGGTAKDTLANLIAAVPWQRSDPAAVKIAEYLRVPVDLLPEREDTPEGPNTSGPALHPFKSLKLFQLDVADRAAATLSSPFSRVLVQMPTGSGKTRTAMEVISRFFNERDGPTHVLWLAHVRELCEQARDAFVEVWEHVGTREVAISLVEASEPMPESLPERVFMVGGLQKLYSELRRKRTLPAFDLVIIDEAHKAVAPTYEQVIEKTIGWGGRLLGLTATPGRIVGSNGENARMAAFFNNRLVGLDPALVGERDAEVGVMHALQRHGILARLQREPIETGLDIKLTAGDLKAIGIRGDYSPELLKRVAGDRKRNSVIIAKLIETADRGLSTIYFGTSVEQSKMMTALLVARGIPAAHVDGTTPRAIRAAHATRFKEGKLKVLLNFDVFSTGFDAPKIDAVFIARPTQSVVLYSQMIGRGLRGPAIGGKDVCVLVDVVDNLEKYSPDLDNIYQFFDEYWGHRNVQEP